jgi:AcrR family transcriptional regulator
MSLLERKIKDKEIRINDIVDSAEKLFLLKGFENMTMDDLSKETEFSKKSLYTYFKSKEEIYQSILLRAFKIFNAIIEEFVCKQDIGTKEKLAQFYKASLSFFIKYPLYYRLISDYKTSIDDFKDPGEITKKCYVEGEKTFQFLFDIINEGIANKSFRNDIDPVNTTLCLWGFSKGISSIISVKSNYLKIYHEKNPEQILETAFNLIIGSLENIKGE